MKNDKRTSYITPKLEIFAVESNDVVTTSIVIVPGDAPGTTPSTPPSTPPSNGSGGFIADDNYLEIW